MKTTFLKLVAYCLGVEITDYVNTYGTGTYSREIHTYKTDGTLQVTGSYFTRFQGQYTETKF